MIKNILPIIFFTTNIFAQNLDSLYYQLQIIKNEIPIKYNHLFHEENIKCGFGTIANIRANFESFDKLKQNEITSILSRPSTQKSIISSDGYFRIHYDETGANAIAYDVNELAEALDSTYNFEIIKLGYLPPPSDNGLGGDDLYDVYVQNLGSGTYGYTDPENLISGSSNYYTSYLIIDNDFGSGYPTNGIDAARVTAAHEFHHAIQIGNYSSDFNDLFYFEITSTAMEEFVFDDINDYYFYLPSFFADPAKRFYYVQGNNAGYNRAIWNIFLRDKFGFDIIKSSWEKMRTSRAIEAIGSAIGDKGSSFKTVFKEFATWIWFTGSRAIPYEFFEEAAFYPQVKPKASYQLSSTEISFSAEHIANEFLLFEKSNSNDSLLVIVSESDINSAVNSSSSTTSYRLKLSSSSNSGDIKIDDNIFFSITLEGASLGMFETVWILNNNIQQGYNSVNELEFAYPQPYVYSKYTNLFLPVSNDGAGDAELYIYSSDMNLVFSGSLKVFVIDKAKVIWDAKDNSGSNLSTGIYYFVTNSNENIKKGKIVIIND